MSIAHARPVSDTMTMLRRNVLRNLRYPSGPITVIGVPAVFLLLFVYVFGQTLGAGMSTGGTREEYLAYITPAILLMAAVSAPQMIAVWISMDMTEGIVARFRTMAIFRGSVLAGHALSGTILIVAAITVLLGITLLLGHRPAADPLDWLAFAGFAVLVGLAFSWLAVALGLAAKRPDSAGNLPLLLMVLPMLSGGFVPVESLPVWMQGFAQYQPFTPIIDTLRGLLAGAPDGSVAVWALSWAVAITVIGYAWSLWLYRRHAAPSTGRATGT